MLRCRGLHERDVVSSVSERTGETVDRDRPAPNLRPVVLPYQKNPNGLASRSRLRG